jgi:thiamine kinase-like enzyme
MSHDFFTPLKGSAETILCMYDFLIRVDEGTRNVLKKVSAKTKNAVESMENDSKRLFPVLPTLRLIPQFNRLLPYDINISALSGGMTNITYLLDVTSAVPGKQKWVLRFPGVGTSEFIDRKVEAANAKLSSCHGLNVSVIWTHDDGRQLSEFYPGKPLSVMTPAEVYLPIVAKTLSKLHQLAPDYISTKIDNSSLFSLELIKEKKPQLLKRENTEKIVGFMQQLNDLMGNYKTQKAFCHGDTTPENFLIGKNVIDDSLECRLIDWEYSKRRSDPFFDIAYLLFYGKYNEKQRQLFLNNYFDKITPEITAWITLYEPIICWWITLWAYSQMASDSVSCDTDEYQSLAREYFAKTLELIGSDRVQEAMVSITPSVTHDEPIERVIIKYP